MCSIAHAITTGAMARSEVAAISLILACAAGIARAMLESRQTHWRQTWVVDALGGDDRSTSGPFRTLARAREAVAQWRNEAGELPNGGVRVLVRKGEYAPLSLTSADSGECTPHAAHTHRHPHQ